MIVATGSAAAVVMITFEEWPPLSHSL